MFSYPQYAASNAASNKNLLHKAQSIVTPTNKATSKAHTRKIYTAINHFPLELTAKQEQGC
jgi:hypothetical protein